MKLFRTFDSAFDPNQPLIQWEGDVRGIIAARRAQETAGKGHLLRLRLVRRVQVRPPARIKPLVPMKAAA